VKLGDLVKVRRCGDIIDCACFFCAHKSNCIGLVVGPSSLNRWYVMFDAGEWELADDEGEVINESR